MDIFIIISEVNRTRISSGDPQSLPSRKADGNPWLSEGGILQSDQNLRCSYLQRKIYITKIPAKQNTEFGHFHRMEMILDRNMEHKHLPFETIAVGKYG